ncbi:conserved membrane protein of unknown function [Candidatus Hydrogenisulfobacillus filiaventi]|uniref:Yip1 domain-containing protein n=1 Tax=Candidatus Hydrogenisulfobacillus filiaventi TaxID=2707344 RepID=A0A6F8ZDG1_9FIRM|nr:hypothetical protein [Bacillota bacterium]CAB1127673.1 conserved membrane protein of unknown function [Candidatus Hydrogenisulfobacillus filiaventi]
MSRPPISLADWKRGRQPRTAQPKKKRGRPASGQRPSPGGDWSLYWRQVLRRPLDHSERGYWTERMLWTNALAGGLLHGAVYLPRLAVLGFFSTLINTLFEAAVFYYVLSWLAAWAVTPPGARRRGVLADQWPARREVIGLSGGFLLAGLAFWLPEAWPVVPAVLFLILWGLFVRGVHRAYRTSWSRALAGGGLGLAAVAALAAFFSLVSGIL